MNRFPWHLPLGIALAVSAHLALVCTLFPDLGVLIRTNTLGSSPYRGEAIAVSLKASPKPRKSSSNNDRQEIYPIYNPMNRELGSSDKNGFGYQTKSTPASIDFPAQSKSQTDPYPSLFSQ